MDRLPRAIDEVARLADAGAVVIVGTCDAARVPEVARAWGPLVSADGNAIDVCVYARSGQRTLANLGEHDRAAVTITSPSTYRSFQVKGRARIAAVDEDDFDRVAMHQRAFADEAASVGLPRESSIRLFETDGAGSAAMMKIRVTVDEVFDQTPGPGAGTRL